jgi:hypothetical protein
MVLKDLCFVSESDVCIITNLHEYGEPTKIRRIKLHKIK